MSSHGSVLKQRARKSVLNFLSQIEGPKILILEKSLVSLFDMNLTFSELEKVGVKKIVQWTSSEEENDDAVTLVYFQQSLSPETLPLCTSLAASVKDRPKRRYLVHCPFVCKLATSRLEALGVDLAKDFAAPVFGMKDLQVAPLEDDTISLQLEGVFGDFHGRADPSGLVHVAVFLKYLEETFGLGLGHVAPERRKFRRINAIGTASKWVADSFLRIAKEAANHRPQEDKAPHVQGDEMRGVGRVGGIVSLGNLLLDTPTVEEDSEAEESRTAVELAIDSIVLIDRRSDLFSVLCSQFTYESLVDELFQIENTKCTVPGVTPMTLTNTGDPLFAEIRDVHVQEIGTILSKKANMISASYKEKDSLKSITEIGNFMEKFKTVQTEHASLSNHVALATSVTQVTNDPLYSWMLKLEDQIMSMGKSASKVLEKIDSMIRRADSLFTLERIVRLICLVSIVYGPKAISGSIEKVLKSLVNKFGMKAIQIVAKLEPAGLLTYATKSSSMADMMSSGTKWPKLREEFKLILDPNQISPDAPLADAYSGYVPLSVRLVQLLNTSWRTSAASLNLVRGPALEIAQECPVATNGAGPNPNASYVAVVFVGGVTRGEIAALRKLSQLEGGRRKFLIITTEITNYSKLINHL